MFKTLMPLTIWQPEPRRPRRPPSETTAASLAGADRISPVRLVRPARRILAEIAQRRRAV